MLQVGLPEERRHLGPGPPSVHLGPTLLTSCLGLGVVSARLIAQLTAPGHPRPVPHHLQPGSARNSLGLLPSTHELQPRALPWSPEPCPGPAGRRGPRPSSWVQGQVGK